MVKVYTTLIKANRWDFRRVPLRWSEEVKKVLIEEGFGHLTESDSNAIQE